jgi:hypothetical protein
MNYAGVLYSVVAKVDGETDQLSFLGSMAFLESAGFGWDADEALQNMGVDRVTQYGSHSVTEGGITWETRVHWLLPIV